MEKLANFLNDVPNMQLLRLFGPTLEVGSYLGRNQNASITMMYPMEKSVGQVPDHVRKEFFALAMAITDKYPVYAIAVGFKHNTGDRTDILTPPEVKGFMADLASPMMLIDIGLCP